MNKAEARIQFADWLKTNHPEIFQKAVNIAEQQTQKALNGLGEDSGGSFWDKFSKAAMGIGTTYLSLKNQKDAMKINLARAQQGLPPIDAATSAPVVRTQVDMSPELQSRLLSTAGSGMNKILLYGGLGLVAFLAMKKFA